MFTFSFYDFCFFFKHGANLFTQQDKKFNLGTQKVLKVYYKESLDAHFEFFLDHCDCCI